MPPTAKRRQHHVVLDSSDDSSSDLDTSRPKRRVARTTGPTSSTGAGPGRPQNAGEEAGFVSAPESIDSASDSDSDANSGPSPTSLASPAAPPTVRFEALTLSHFKGFGTN